MDLEVLRAFLVRPDPRDAQRISPDARRARAHRADHGQPVPDPRKRGVLFDLYVSNPDVQTYPLEEISVPTLIINAKDDGLSAFGNAAQAARRIAQSKLTLADRGGHLLLGNETRIQEEIAAFASLTS